MNYKCITVFSFFKYSSFLKIVMRPLIFLSIMSTFAFSPKEGFGHSLIIVDDLLNQ